MAHTITASAKTHHTAQIWPMLTILGIIAYIVIDVVLAFLRPDYHWLHNAESDYGRGPYFWLMDINFVVRCLFSLALVGAILTHFPGNKAIRLASFWLILWAIASGLLAFFTDNPYGYSRLWSGTIHLLLAFVAFISVVVAMIMFRRLAPLMRLGSLTAYFLAVLPAIAIISLILLGHASFRPHSLGGLYERIFLASVLAWEFILALRMKTDSRAAAA